MQPRSRGVGRLGSANPSDPLIIDGNYLGTDQDLKALMKAIDAARELGRQTAFDTVREAELIPGPTAGAQEVQDLARLGSASFGHAVGTCKIGVLGLQSSLPATRASNRRSQGGIALPSVSTSDCRGMVRVHVPLLPQGNQCPRPSASPARSHRAGGTGLGAAGGGNASVTATSSAVSVETRNGLSTLIFAVVSSAGTTAFPLGVGSAGLGSSDLPSPQRWSHHSPLPGPLFSCRWRFPAACP